MRHFLICQNIMLSFKLDVCKLIIQKFAIGCSFKS